MNRFGKQILAGCVATALGFSMAGAVFAHEHGKKEAHGMSGEYRGEMPAGVEVVKAWARASAGMAKNGGAYLTVLNGGKEGDRLVAAEAGIAKKVELHTHINDNGVMKMRQVDGIDVPAGKGVMLKPGSYHVMFMGLNNPLKEGEKFPLTLTFEKAGKKTVEVTVMGVGAMKPGGHGMDHDRDRDRDRDHDREKDGHDKDGHDKDGHGMGQKH